MCVSFSALGHVIVGVFNLGCWSVGGVSVGILLHSTGVIVVEKVKPKDEVIMQSGFSLHKLASSAGNWPGFAGNVRLITVMDIVNQGIGEAKNNYIFS